MDAGFILLLLKKVVLEVQNLRIMSILASPVNFYESNIRSFQNAQFSDFENIYELLLLLLNVVLSVMCLNHSIWLFRLGFVISHF